MSAVPANDELIEGMDSLHACITGQQRKLFQLIAEADRREAWRDSGARDMAHWLSIRYGISCWKANRWLGAAHALENLPRLSEAFASGELGIDKVVELARFATAETEGRLVSWAKGVSGACIRRKADLASRPSIDDARDGERARFLSWWYLDGGRRFGLEAELPAAQGVVVARALDRLAEQVPAMPGEEDACHAASRRADALVALCSSSIAADGDPDRATVVVHAQLEDLISGEHGCALEGGGVIHPETARRLLCSARLQTVIEDQGGDPVRLGRLTREPSAWMTRQVRYRDFECRFPGCGARRFTQVHHIVFWEHGGSTDLDNLLLVCTFHHKLVHEYGWAVRRDRGGSVRWFRPRRKPLPRGPGAAPGDGRTRTCSRSRGVTDRGRWPLQERARDRADAPERRGWRRRCPRKTLSYSNPQELRARVHAVEARTALGLLAAAGSAGEDDLPA